MIGADVNAATVDLVKSGTEPFPGEHQLQEYLSDVVTSGLLTATTETSAAVSVSDVVVVAVPLFVDEEAAPDFRAMDAAATAIGRGLRRGALISFETTLPVGTTRKRLAPMLETESGLVAGRDIFIAFSPERVFTGRVFEDLRRYPKLVGGTNPASAERAVEFYEAVLDFDPRADLERENGVWDLGSAEAAELAKLAETTYRDVNIGLANQFARYADRVGLDIYNVIEACNSQPFSHIHQPGVAVGGHCIPVYPRLYLWNDPEASIVRTAREANSEMPAYAVSVLNSALNGMQGKRVAILGAAYRGGVRETAFSGVFPVVDEVSKRGGIAAVHDPMYTEDEIRALGLEPFRQSEPARGAIIQTAHEEYRNWGAVDIPGIEVLVDGRRIARDELWAPARVVALGRPG
mgnify:FL=1